jgi:hypothetical protein
MSGPETADRIQTRFRGRVIGIRRVMNSLRGSGQLLLVAWWLGGGLEPMPVSAARPSAAHGAPDARRKSGGTLPQPGLLRKCPKLMLGRMASH